MTPEPSWFRAVEVHGSVALPSGAVSRAEGRARLTVIPGDRLFFFVTLSHTCGSKVTKEDPEGGRSRRTTFSGPRLEGANVPLARASHVAPPNCPGLEGHWADEGQTDTGGWSRLHSPQPLNVTLTQGSTRSPPQPSTHQVAQCSEKKWYINTMSP